MLIEQYDLEDTMDFGRDEMVASLVLAEEICAALGRYVYFLRGRIHDTGPVTTTGLWLGRLMGDPSSNAPAVAQAKMSELLYAGAGREYGLITTPTSDCPFSTGWMGGAALGEDMISVSGWHQEHDRLLALLMLYAMRNPITLHHVGRRYPTGEAFNQASERRWGDPIVRDAEDHLRHYFPTPYGYEELQLWLEGPRDSAVHLDFFTVFPVELLLFVAHAFDQEPQIWDDAGLNDPIGVVWVESESTGEKVGIMARDTWWVVENEPVQEESNL